MKKIIITIMILMISMFVLVGCSNETQEPTVELVPEETVTEEIIIEETVDPEFDIPSLIGKSYSEIKEILGEPESEKKLDALTKLRLNADYDKRGTFVGKEFELKVESLYDNVTLISICDRNDEMHEYNGILVAGNLEENSNNYNLEGLVAKLNQNKYTCVKVLRK